MTWIASLTTDDPPGISVGNHDAFGLKAALLSKLCRRWGRYVSIEMDCDRYKVKVLPVNMELYTGPLAMGLHYTGTDLNLILSRAVSEVAALYSGQVGYTVSRQERIRWVA
jgi:hypothetical protein